MGSLVCVLLFPNFKIWGNNCFLFGSISDLSLVLVLLFPNFKIWGNNCFLFGSISDLSLVCVLFFPNFKIWGNNCFLFGSIFDLSLIYLSFASFCSPILKFGEIIASFLSLSLSLSLVCVLLFPNFKIWGNNCFLSFSFSLSLS